MGKPRSKAVDDRIQKATDPPAIWPLASDLMIAETGFADLDEVENGAYLAMLNLFPSRASDFE